MTFRSGLIYGVDKQVIIMEQLFDIFRIDAPKALEMAAKADAPGAYNLEELIIGIKGKLEHFIDFKTHNVAVPLVSFIAKGKAHRVVPKLQDAEFDMWVLRFKN